MVHVVAPFTPGMVVDALIHLYIQIYLRLGRKACQLISTRTSVSFRVRDVRASGRGETVWAGKL